MSRYLFVVPPIAGRVRPTVAIGRELTARGHEVAWTTDHELLPPGAAVVPPGGPHDGGEGAVADLVAAAAARAQRGRRSPAGWLEHWDDFLLPLARTMLPAVHAAVDGFLPDALVVDDQALAGAAVGTLSRLPWATLVPTSAGLGDPLADLPAIARQVRRRACRFLHSAGLDAVTAVRIDPQASPHLVVACTTEELAGPADDHRARPGRCTFIGPCLDGASLDGPSDGAPFAWDRLDHRRPLVVVTLETPHWHRGARLYAQAAEAVASLDVQAVVIGPPDLVTRPGPRVVVVPRAPLRSLVRRAAAVVCDGGDAVVAEALSHGVPLVVVPTVGDQATVAGQLTRAGAAVRLDPHSATATPLARALTTVLTDPRFEDGANRLRTSLAAAGGPHAAAAHLETLLAARIPT
jgi:MGT family glycosyltransferase